MLAGLIGHGIGASLSPKIHEAEAKNCGFDLEYRLYDLPVDASKQDLSRLLAEIEGYGTLGVNVTHPFKRTIMEFLDEVSQDAQAIGAVNTIAFRNGRRIGYNTDWSGFLDSLRRDLPGVDTTCVSQVGAGGAGSATAFGLLQGGVRTLYINDVNAKLAGQLVAQLQRLFPDRIIEPVSDANTMLANVSGIVQATPVGMTGHEGMPISPDFLKPEHWLIDIIYHPRETLLLREARERGCQTMNGLGMVVAQAALAFEIITGHVPDVDRMRSHLRSIA
ncbi:MULTISPECIES: shikimate dehydrogenase [unclassified Sphingobium]|uniref:shikimate dehydrogenase n=1 Tax=unclassified Sphingobium TaxID=2611147 RepID=UPI000D16861C|nr:MULTISPECIES: shikimate dehydrogenase [unclassified Sphingobium]MBG6120230.1 shikimate dehydrogenase [Sphingobium sp. JAI105]PSO09957.1 shikimate dehydrogenase [Sphingobium sp. AEW4]TWD00114.1 shikimate dehydrogenase [Sphingobium sp. AEW010]TWD19251.1 shikimate dehydrogenase [Sphingobium sp. AEW013]TWD22084.1 shikimate dehydrogenase [Sphingobium sp. AEW001]